MARITASAGGDLIQYVTEAILPTANACVHPAVDMTWVDTDKVRCMRCGQQITINPYVPPAAREGEG